MSFSSTDPATLFGFGTWELLQNRFLIGAGHKFDVEETGGTDSVTLTVNHLPRLSGSIVMHGKYSGTAVADANGVFSAGATVSGKYLAGTSSNGANSIDVLNYTNGGQGFAHENMPPYIGVYMWRRLE